MPRHSPVEPDRWTRVVSTPPGHHDSSNGRGGGVATHTDAGAAPPSRSRRAPGKNPPRCWRYPRGGGVAAYGQLEQHRPHVEFSPVRLPAVLRDGAFPVTDAIPPPGVVPCGRGDSVTHGAPPLPHVRDRAARSAGTYLLPRPPPSDLPHGRARERRPGLRVVGLQPGRPPPASRAPRRPARRRRSSGAALAGAERPRCGHGLAHERALAPWASPGTSIAPSILDILNHLDWRQQAACAGEIYAATVLSSHEKVAPTRARP